MLKYAGQEVHTFAEEVGVSADRTLEANKKAKDAVEEMIQYGTSAKNDMSDDQRNALISQIQNVLMEGMRVRQANALANGDAFNAEVEMAGIVGKINNLIPSGKELKTIDDLGTIEDSTKQYLDALNLAIKEKERQIYDAIIRGQDTTGDEQALGELRTRRGAVKEIETAGDTFTDRTHSAAYHRDPGDMVLRTGRVSSFENEESNARADNRGSELQHRINQLNDIQRQLRDSSREDTDEYRFNEQAIGEYQKALDNVDLALDQNNDDINRRLQASRDRAKKLDDLIHDAIKNRRGDADMVTLTDELGGGTETLGNVKQRLSDTQRDIGGQEATLIDSVRKSYEESIKAIEYWSHVLSYSTRTQEQHEEALRRMTQAETAADNYWEKAGAFGNDFQRNLLGDDDAKAQYDNVRKQIDDALQKRGKAYADILKKEDNQSSALRQLKTKLLQISFWIVQ